MINIKNSVTLGEARLAARRPKPVIHILIFILVMIIASNISGVVIAGPMMWWLLNDWAFITAAKTLDIQGMMDVIARMPWWLMAVQLFATAAQTACAVFYCRRIEKRSLRSMGFTKKGAFAQYLTGFGIGAAMLMAACLICVLTGNMELMLSPSIPVAILLVFLAGYLVQGMAEEVLVRGYFMVSFANSMKTKYAAAIAVGVSSMIFAALHLTNPGVTWLALLNLVLCGVFFAVYILRTDNIWGACAAHSAWNFFQGNVVGVQVSGMASDASVFTAKLKGSGELINGGSFGLEGGLAVTAVMGVAILLVLFLPAKKAAEAPEEGALAQPEEAVDAQTGIIE